jgi:hypothetical protein
MHDNIASHVSCLLDFPVTIYLNILSLHIVVLLFMGVFKNITPANREGVLYSDY